MPDVIKHALVTEKASVLIDKENSLQFVVDTRASKDRIKREIEKRFEVKVKSIRTLVTTDGRKKAIVTLMEDYKASEVVARLGVF